MFYGSINWIALLTNLLLENWFSWPLMFFIFIIKFPTRRYLYFLYTFHKSKMMSKNVKQHLISCPTLMLRYVSLNILSEKKGNVLVLMFDFEEAS